MGVVKKHHHAQTRQAVRSSPSCHRHRARFSLGKRESGLSATARHLTRAADSNPAGAVYGKLAATDALACAPTSGMDVKPELRFPAMNAPSAAEEAPQMERSGSLAAFNDIMHACLQLSPDEMLQIPPLSLAPDQLRA